MGGRARTKRRRAPRRRPPDLRSPSPSPSPFCAVCASRAIRPVSLPCAHRFCLECVEGAAREGPLRCPLCRRRCAAWLRRRKPEPGEEDRTRDPDGDAASVSESPPRRICAPGEIRSEYEAERERYAAERRLSEERRDREAERLIRTLREKERAEIESREAELRADEKYATELARTLNAPSPPHVGPREKSTLDSYVLRADGPPRNGKGGTLASDASPELISTGARCGKFFKDFFNGKLWGSDGPSKPEPKTREPRRSSPAGGPETSARSGIVGRRTPCGKVDAKNSQTQIFASDADIRSEDSLIQELSYFKPIHPAPIVKFGGKLIRSVAVRKPVGSNSHHRTEEGFEGCGSLEKLRGNVLSKSSYKSAFACCFVLPVSQKRDEPSKIEIKSNGCDTSDVDCARSTPKRSSKRKRKIADCSRSCSKLNDNNERSNPRSPKRLRRFSLCDSSPLNGDCEEKEDGTVLSKTKFKNLNGNGFKVINDCNNKLNLPGNNTRNLRSKNHCSSSDILLCGRNALKSSEKKKQNGSLNKNIKSLPLNVDYSSLDLDPSIVAEQKRIEELIIQEKNDYALAKKLQRQMEKNSVFTGYTVRTAARRQATLTEMVTPSKNMRI